MWGKKIHSNVNRDRHRLPASASSGYWLQSTTPPRPVDHLTLKTHKSMDLFKFKNNDRVKIIGGEYEGTTGIYLHPCFAIFTDGKKTIHTLPQFVVPQKDFQQSHGDKASPSGGSSFVSGGGGGGGGGGDGGGASKRPRTAS
ncbi:hypothetical protein L2E82_34724 [Cichorium intybus]|uniref:Uncharacterized protein n=1 Tax=Cichorium intybus TaxID=13427 RepID=A0ACB9BMK6_CICIN|nr:hypothetical protein L2E82_34724 [Cichorium intybus]